MAKNDAVLIDGIISQRMEDGLPSRDKGEVFEYFALEQILKNFDLSKDDINAGWIDGELDGGIDGFYAFINGILLQDCSNFTWPKNNTSIAIYLISCKHHDTFKEATINSILATVQELFGFSLNNDALKGEYSKNLLQYRSILLLAYTQLAITNPHLTVDIYYASRGSTESIGKSVKARGMQVEEAVRNSFSACSSKFNFLGAGNFIEIYRKTKKLSLDLPFTDNLSGSNPSYIVLTTLLDYYNCVKDDDGELRRYLFDSNVRDYLGDARVNQDIAESLHNELIQDFWWLNNGITILATRAAIAGKIIQLQDAQIVNGLQTTETIYRHFRAGSSASGSRTIAIKVIISEDEAIRDKIIHATNNQSVVPLASLHATDKIQRDIEQILERYDWYYERRQNYYRNIGRPPSRFVTPIYIASAFVSLVVKDPVRGATLKTRFMRNEDSYSRVFSDSYPIEIWPSLVGIFKKVEDTLSEIRPQGSVPGEKFLKNWRGLVSLLVVSRIFGRFSFSMTDLVSLNLDLINKGRIEEIWNIVRSRRELVPYIWSPDSRFVRELYKSAAQELGIEAIQALGGWDPKPTIPHKSGSKPTADFLDSVDMLLPRQRWPQGIHFEVAQKLGCGKKKVATAILVLIELGRRYRQDNGILFGADGRIVDAALLPPCPDPAEDFNRS